MTGSQLSAWKHTIKLKPKLIDPQNLYVYNKSKPNAAHLKASRFLKSIQNKSIEKM